MSIQDQTTYGTAGGAHREPFIGAAGGAAGAPAPDGGFKRNRLSTFNGVYIPCCLNIMGVVLFLRLGWAVGNAGVLPTLGMFAVGKMQTTLTVLSLTAIVTNGSMAGGGAYYVISRSMGPAMGGAIGLLFYIAYAISSAFYTIGVAAELKALFWPPTSAGAAADPQYWLTLGLCSGTLLLLLAISLAGAHGYAKINVVLFVGQMTGVAYGAMNFIWGKQIAGAPRALGSGGEFYGFGWDTFNGNLWSDYAVQGTPHHPAPPVPQGPLCVSPTFRATSCSWAGVFAVIFPAVTGVMEGANLSGDLDRPERSIGVGTLSAIATAAASYVLLIISMGGAFDRDALRANGNFYQESAGVPGLVAQGILTSCFSSGLQALFGGARILQALAKDDLFPCLSYFAKGSRVGNEPRRAVLLTWAIAQGVCFAGELDTVASAVTCCFCMTYGLVNFSCFLLHMGGTVNFRPLFKFHSWHTALFGAVLNFIMGGLMQPTCTIILWVLFFASAAFISRSGGPVKESWGDVTQALFFHQARKWMLRLDGTTMHPKNWRPSLLLLCGATDDVALLRWCNGLKKGGLLVLGEVVLASGAMGRGGGGGGGVFGSRRHEELDASAVATATERRASWQRVFKEEGVKAVAQVVVAASARAGAQHFMLAGGLGGLRCNTVVLKLRRRGGPGDGGAPLIRGRAGTFESMMGAAEVQAECEALGVMRDTSMLRKNLLLVAVGAAADAAAPAAAPAATAAAAACIDIYTLVGMGANVEGAGGLQSDYLPFALTLAHILRQRHSGGASAGSDMYSSTGSQHSGGSGGDATGATRVRVVALTTGLGGSGGAQVAQGLQSQVQALAREIRIRVDAVSVVDMAEHGWNPDALPQRAQSAAVEAAAAAAGRGGGRFARLNALCRAASSAIRATSAGAIHVFVPLPELPTPAAVPDAETACSFMEALYAYVEGVPSVTLARAGEAGGVVSTELGTPKPRERKIPTTPRGTRVLQPSNYAVNYV
jgi:potassium/chloride transporter 9